MTSTSVTIIPVALSNQGFELILYCLPTLPFGRSVRVPKAITFHNKEEGNGVQRASKLLIIKQENDDAED
jgi:hypothetical protein